VVDAGYALAPFEDDGAGPGRAGIPDSTLTTSNCRLT
jgi:hypothetical protein